METLEQIQARHRKEQRDLQSQITQKKRNATKKTRKGVNAECEDLERSLKLKQEQELATLDSDHSSDTNDGEESVEEPTTAPELPPIDPQPVDRTLNGVVEGLQKSSLEEEPNGTAPNGGGPAKKRNRQKDRLARRAAEQEAEMLKAEEEAANLPNWKKQERSAMIKAFKDHGLVEQEIAPDGHCLFSAVADQLKQVGVPLSQGGEAAQSQDGPYKVVRMTAARYMEGHPDEFAGFLDEPLGSHVHKIRDTAEWGGQLELIALARSYNIEISVIQDGRVDKFAPETDSKERETIWLAYYRHGYGLGEHYNSLRKSP
jgi:OTU domain-containing protein 6